MTNTFIILLSDKIAVLNLHVERIIQLFQNLQYLQILVKVCPMSCWGFFLFAYFFFLTAFVAVYYFCCLLLI